MKPTLFEDASLNDSLQKCLGIALTLLAIVTLSFQPCKLESGGDISLFNP